MSFKTLYLLRHAKAESASLTQDDHARHLSERGVAEARQLGKIFALKALIVPNAVYCSSATRTRETLKAFTESYGAALPAAVFSDKLYHASAGSMLAMVQEFPDGARSALIVGHNPGTHQLASQLACEGEERALDEVSLHYPPCTLSAFRLPVARWQDAKLREAELTHLLTPESIERENLSSVA